MAVDEALRLYPPAHTLVRRALGGGAVLGHPFQPGGILAVSVFGMHRNPRVWPDPEGYDPNRFTGHAAAVAECVRHRYAYAPFGGGPRSCIGVHLATDELVVAVALVVRASSCTPTWSRSCRRA